MKSMLSNLGGSLPSFDMKKRCVQFVVKSAMGRFLKEVSKHHLEDPKMSMSGMKFELKDLELNTDVINEEVLGHRPGGSNDDEENSMGESHLPGERDTMSSKGEDPELHQNDDGAPLRLVHGQISSLKGEVLWTLKEPRSIEVEGIDLTFDVVNNVNLKSAGRDEEDKAALQASQISAAAGGGGSMLGTRQNSATSSSSSNNAMYSSLLAGQVTEEMLREEVLEEKENQSIDEGVNVLSTVIKDLVHNTIGEVNEITIRFRIPPADRQIIPGKPLPLGTVEMLIHLPTINVKDETDRETSIGNSFRKRIQASGWFVQIYDADRYEHLPQQEEGSEEEGEEEATATAPTTTTTAGGEGSAASRYRGSGEQVIKMENTVFSGDTNSVCNEVVLQYFDIEKRGATRWRTEISLGEVHCLLTPPQLTRLISAAQVLTRAPTANDKEAEVEDLPPHLAGRGRSEAQEDEKDANDDAADIEVDENGEERLKKPQARTKPVTDKPSTLRFECAKMSVALLQSDTPAVVRRCWKALRDGKDVYGPLSTPHYSLTLDRLLVFTTTPVDTRYLEPDDVLKPVFERYGGSYLSLALRSINLMEKQTDKDKEPIIRLRRLDGTDPGKYQLALTIITSCPMSPSLAEFYGFKPTSRYRNVVRQLTSLELNSAVEVTTDALLMDRLVYFSKLISDLLEQHNQRVDGDDYQEEIARLHFKEAVDFRRKVAALMDGKQLPPSFPLAGGRMQSNDSFDFDALDLENVTEVPDDQPSLTSTAPPSSTSRATRKASAPPPPPKPVLLPYDTSSSFDLEVNTISFELRLLKERVPNPDTYGPLTQDLFNTLCSHSGVYTGSNENDALPNIDEYLSKSFVLSVSGFEFRLPNGNTDFITINAMDFTLALKDQLTGKQSTIAQVELTAPEHILQQQQMQQQAAAQQQQQHTNQILGGGFGSPFDSPTAGVDAMFPPPPPLTIRFLTEEELRVIYQREAEQDSRRRRGHTPGLGRIFKSDSPDEATERKESEIHQIADVSVTLTLYRIKMSFYQDYLLLLLFAADEIAETSASAVKRAQVELDPEKAAKLQEQLEEERRLHQDPNAAELFFSTVVPTTVAPASTTADGTESQISTTGSGVVMSSRKRKRLKKMIQYKRPSYESKVSVAVHIDTAQVLLWAPRLNTDGIPISEPLFMRFSPSMRTKLHQMQQQFNAQFQQQQQHHHHHHHAYHPHGGQSSGNHSSSGGVEAKELLFHKYVVNAQGVDVHVCNNSLSQTTTEMLVNVRADHLELGEKLPQLPRFDPKVFLPPATDPTTVTPQWGQEISLLQGYANLYRRSNYDAAAGLSSGSGDAGASSPTSEPSRKVFRMCMYRTTDTSAKTQDLNVDLQLDRVAINHQPAYDGDHWLFVLMNFATDAPISTVEDDESLPDDSQFAVDPYNCKTRVVVRAIDTLLEYRPYGHKSMLLALAPTLVVDTGSLVSSSPKSTIQIGADSVDIYMNADWPYELVGYDAAERHPAHFGATGNGLVADLEDLGFLKMGAIKNIDRPGSPNILLRMKESIQKPLLVEVFGLHVELEAASDSFKLFQVLMSHFGGGLDRDYFPSPFILIGVGIGSDFLQVKPAAPPPQGPQVNVLVENFSEIINERLRTKYPTQPYRPPGSGLDTTSSKSTTTTVLADSTRRSRTKKRNQAKVVISEWDDMDVVVDNDTNKTEDEFDDDFDDDTPIPPGPPVKLTKASAVAARSGDKTSTLKHGLLEDDDGGFVGIEKDDSPDEGPKVVWNDRNLAFTAALAKGEFPSPTGEEAPAMSRNGFSQLFGPGGSTQHFGVNQVEPVALSSLFSGAGEGYLSVRSRQHRTGTAGGETQPIELKNMPPISTEIMVSRVSATIKFFGGADLGSTISSTRPEEYNTRHTFHGDFRQHTTMDGRRTTLQSTRNVNEVVVAHLHGVKVQVDLFEPGHAKAMHLLLSVASVEARDKVKVSKVNQLLSCTIPPEHRDADTPMFEMKWITNMPQLGGGGGSDPSTTTATTRIPGVGLAPKPEEEISIRCQPLHVALDESTMNVLKNFFIDENLESIVRDAAGLASGGSFENINAVGGIGASGNPSTISMSSTTVPASSSTTQNAISATSGAKASEQLFFNKFLLHPVDLSFSWFPKHNPTISGFANLEPMDFMSVVSLEGSRVKLSGICIHRTSQEDLPLNLLEAFLPQITPNLLLLLCGLGPVRTAGEVAGAVSELVVAPWKSLKKNRGLYSGIIKGLRNCGSRLTGEAFRVTSATSHAGHQLVHTFAAPVQPSAHKDPMLRGDQPAGVSDGLSRGAQALNNGLVGMSEAVQICVGEEGSVAGLPLVLLVPVDGALRGLTEVALGLRNFFRPDSMQHDMRQFKPGGGERR